MKITPFILLLLVPGIFSYTSPYFGFGVPPKFKKTGDMLGPTLQICFVVRIQFTFDILPYNIFSSNF